MRSDPRARRRRLARGRLGASRRSDRDARARRGRRAGPETRTWSAGDPARQPASWPAKNDRESRGWSGRDRPDVAALPEGFALVDRGRTTTLHPMRGRNGEEVEARLRQCSLYDATLDLAVETADGEVAGYSLFWFDPVTHGGAGRADARRGRVPAARTCPRHADRRHRSTGEARRPAPEGRLQHRRGARALRRRRVPGDLDGPDVQLEETGRRRVGSRR